MQKVKCFFIFSIMMCAFFANTVFASEPIKEVNIYYDTQLMLDPSNTYGEYQQHLVENIKPSNWSSQTRTSSEYYCDALNVWLMCEKSKDYYEGIGPIEDHKINTNIKLQLKIWIKPYDNYYFDDFEKPVIKLNDEIIMPQTDIKGQGIEIKIPINNPTEERASEISKIQFIDFEIPVNGTEYKADLKMPSDVSGTITAQNWKLFNKNITGKAYANDNVGFVATIQLKDDNWSSSPVGYLNGKKSDKVNRISDKECEFTWNYTIGYTDKIKIKEQSPETVEYANGEDVKLYVKATGADSYQWTVFELGSGVKQTLRPNEIAGATKSEYTIAKADSSLDGKQYRCTLTSDDGTIYSNMFKLKLVEKKVEEPAKTEQPTTQEPEKVITYEVDFETNGGNKISTVEVKAKEKVTKPTEPKKDGYTFDGWYSDSKLTKAFDFNTAIDDDITLYAKWTEVKKEEQPTTKPAEKTWSKASGWAEEELNKANELGVIPELFNKQDLTQNITRKEFAHVAVKLYEKLTGNKATAIAKNPFTDTADTEVLKAYNIGITLGTSDTTFTPDALITREQMATMMTRALTKAGIDTTVDLNKVTKFADDNEMHSWGKESIYYMSNIEIIKGIGNNQFGVLGNATREQSLLISERSAEKFAK